MVGFFLLKVKFHFYFYSRMKEKELRVWKRVGLLEAFHSHEQCRFDKMWLPTYMVEKGVVNSPPDMLLFLAFLLFSFYCSLSKCPWEEISRPFSFLFSEYMLLLLLWYSDYLTISYNNCFLFKIVFLLYSRLYHFLNCLSEVFIE